jgi:hypothetical protein
MSKREHLGLTRTCNRFSRTPRWRPFAARRSARRAPAEHGDGRDASGATYIDADVTRVGADDAALSPVEESTVSTLNDQLAAPSTETVPPDGV